LRLLLVAYTRLMISITHEVYAGNYMCVV